MSALTYATRILAPLLFAAALVCCTARPGAEGDGSRPAGTPTGKTVGEITRERAIEIAREHVSFEPRSVEAVAEEQDGRSVWRVTFRGRPPGPEHAMGEFEEIVVDRRTGEIVSLAMS